MVASPSRSAGTTRLTSPHSRAVAASITSPVRAISAARLRPTWRATATMGVWQNSPPRPPGVAKRASSEATIRSALAANWAPAAVANPCTWATTTWGAAAMAFMARVQASKSPRSSGSSMAAISPRSWPEEKTGPVEASTTPATSSISPTDSKACSSSPSTAPDRQLRRSGRFKVTVT